MLIKAYCVGVSKYRALPLYPVKAVMWRAILILPRKWLGQYEYRPGVANAKYEARNEQEQQQFLSFAHEIRNRY